MLDENRREEYARDGFLVLRGFFDPGVVAEVAAEAERLAVREDIIHDGNLRCRWQTVMESGETKLEALDPVVDLAPAIGRLARDERLLATLASLFGGPARLFKDKLIYKPPGLPGQSTHQDYIAWPTFPKSFTTVLVAIDPATTENGCLYCYAGQHRRGCLSPMDGDFHDLPSALFDEATRIDLVLAPGDIAIFGGFLPHGSGPNRSSSFRRHLYLSYNAAADGGDRRDRHYAEFHAWLRRRYAEYGVSESFFR